MSRIANKPVTVESNVQVNIANSVITVKGGKGALERKLPRGIKIVHADGQIQVEAEGNSKTNKALSGTFRALIQNMVSGVSQGYVKQLNLVGVGYRASMQGQDLNLSLGFSHPVVFKAPEGITFRLDKQTSIFIEGISKELVGQVAANIRSLRPPEPYKGKGVRYSDEQVILKEAKKK